MPLYEYECTRCHHRFEKLQRFSDPPADQCPACGGAVSQLLSPPAIQFKGSGWYVTDYARKSSSPSSGNGKTGTKAADAGGGNGSGAKSESTAKSSENAGKSSDSK